MGYLDVEAGQCFLGCIVEIKKYEMTVSLPNRMQGYLPITHISEEYKNLLVKVSEDKEITETVYSLSELYSIGQLIVVKVKSAVLDGTKVKVILSAMPEDVNASLGCNALAGGTVIQGAIKSTEDNGFMVNTGISKVQSAFLPLTAGSKESIVGVGSVLLCAVSKVFEVDSNSDKARIKLTVYTSRICKPSKPRISSIIPGTVIKATIEEVVAGGLKLSTAWNRGIVSWKHLKTPNEKLQSYSVGQKVTARILYVADLSSELHCTLNTKICSQSILKDPFCGLDVGDLVENARVRTSDKHGVYVSLPNDNLGFCTTQKLAEGVVTEAFIQKNFPVNSYKTCRLIGANLIDQLFVVGLKKSVLSEEFNFANIAKNKIERGKIERRKRKQSEENSTDHTPTKACKRKNDENSSTPKRCKTKHSTTKPSSDESKEVQSDSEPNYIKKKQYRKTKTKNIEDNSDPDRDNEQACLQVASSGFDWTGSILNDKEEIGQDSSSDDEAQKEKEQKTVKRKSKFERMQEAKKEEMKIRELELQRLDPDREPETALDFEERIERNPHSSTVWIEYVSFYLENAETEKAKRVAARSLQVVPPTLEDARLDLWNVVLRLEVMYGTPESVEASFKEALVTNDELKIFFIMLDIYANANKFKDAEHVINRMTKKYSHDKEVWIKAFSFFFKANQPLEARNIFDKSLVCLPKQDHLDVINRFAQFEIKYGDAERGKTIFEKMISNCPKRTDIWNVYFDLLIKMNDIKGGRYLLERMTGLKLRMNVMKTVFKKYLNFEKQHGTPHSVEEVKARAADYIASKLPD